MTGIDAVREAIEDAEDTRGPKSYTAWMGAAATIALAHDRTTFLPDSVERSLLARALREAEESARGVDGGDADEFERERRDVVLNRRFRRAFEELFGYPAVVEISERRAYAGTIESEDGDAEERFEEWLEASGYRRNAIAHLKYRERDGDREYEQGSWAYRRTPSADRQLHVRLFDGADPGTVDVYAHREASIVRGKEHLGPQDYRAGVCEVVEDASSWVAGRDGLSFRRHEELPTGTEPRRYDCSDVPPLVGTSGDPP